MKPFKQYTVMAMRSLRQCSQCAHWQHTQCTQATLAITQENIIKAHSGNVGAANARSACQDYQWMTAHVSRLPAVTTLAPKSSIAKIHTSRLRNCGHSVSLSLFAPSEKLQLQWASVKCNEFMLPALSHEAQEQE